MTESVITISPKMSPYRSQISTRPVSPNPSSSVGYYVSSSHHRNLDHQSYSNEKLQLRKLNDQFLSYIERVRIFETYNNCLTIHCEQIRNAQEHTKAKLDLLRQEFDEYQQEKSQREKKDLQLEYETINENEKQVNTLKNKQNYFQQEHDLYRKQIMDLQKQSVELQGKTEELRFEYENLNDDNNHYRKHTTYYQLLKSSILDEITRQRDIHQRLQLEVDDLKMQKQISTQAYEADTQAIEIRNDNILYDLTTNFRFDGNGKNVLTQMLNEIREEYKIKDNDMREELHRKYLYEYNQHVKKQVDQNFLESNRDDIERRHLSNELNSLNDNRLLLRQKLTLIQEHYKQYEMNFQREIKRQKDMEEKYDQQINNLRLSVKEYENLLSNNSLIRQPTLEDEVNKYRQLLEGSDQQRGLRQLINISNKIDHFSPINRPKTPPPPPPPLPHPIQKSESASTLPLFSSLTRQNSISENSYETALISQSSTSTTTTNQQYLTLDSVNDKIFHSDYDTDNDQSQTIQYMSGRSSRLTSEADTTPTALTPTDQESLPPLPPSELINYDETIVEISIDTSHTEGVINETLPFIPMNIVAPIEIDENKLFISDEQQSPIISTLEKREEVENKNIESTILPSTETVIPITIDVDSKPVDESIESKTISPSTPIMSANEPSKPTVSPVPVSDEPATESTVVEVSISNQPATESTVVEVPISNQPTTESTVVEVPISNQPATESTVVEVPISTLPTTNPLAKLMLTMLPNATPFVPSSNGTANRSISPLPLPISAMSNDATPFIPNQHGNGQQHLNNTNAGHWSGAGARGGGGGNRRGQSGGGGFHHGGGGGGGNQRSGGAGGNWQQGGGGGGPHKQRRGGK